METKDVEWCPQHGYPLPCHKCGMPLSQVSQKEIYEKGKQAGIREVVEWIKDTDIFIMLSPRKRKELEEWGIG